MTTIIKKIGINILVITVYCFIPLIVSLITGIKFPIVFCIFHIILSIFGIIKDLSQLKKLKHDIEFMTAIYDFSQAIGDSKPREHPQKKMLQILAAYEARRTEFFLLLCLTMLLTIITDISLAGSYTISFIILTLWSYEDFCVKS